jgi:hypothetical protein
MKNIQVELLWFDQRDGNGIATDSQGFEYYIDSSVLMFNKTELNTKSDGKGVSRTGMNLLIDLNESIKDCRCGKNVRIAK